jgi:hypothetical protein
MAADRGFSRDCSRVATSHRSASHGQPWDHAAEKALSPIYKARQFFLSFAYREPTAG